MRRRLFALLTALVLSLTLLPGAQALTADQARELLERYYVDPIPDAVAGQDTVEGVLEALGDPYTDYFTRQEYEEFLSVMQDTVLVGIGIQNQLHPLGLEVVRVIPDSPAEEAGLRSGDVVTAVDGRSAAGQALETVGAWLRGEAGTAVRITVLRGETSRDYTLLRRKVVVPATVTDLVDGHIGYIQCETFGGETLGHFQDGIQTYDAQTDHWIVDLRYNSGGELGAAVQSVGEFVGAGYLAYLRDAEGKYGVYPREEAASTISPVIVLTGEYTASAAEIFASAVRDRQGGISVGGRTYGKGVVQSLLDREVEPDYFTDDAMKITTYRFFSANGSSTDRVGIVPDLMVLEEHVLPVALLLSGRAPMGNTAGTLRISHRWRWYVDLETALSEEYLGAFTELLEALPESAGLALGSGGVDGWEELTAEQVAQRLCLEGYRSRAFLDVEDSPYAYQINVLGTYGIMEGNGKGIFRPEDGLTRAELCALLVQAIRYPQEVAPCPFTDVDQSAWYAGAINAAYAAGLIDGYEDGTFRPDRKVDHQQLITILARVAAQLSIPLHTASLSEPEALPEGAQRYADWARNALWLLAESQETLAGPLNLLWDEPENIAPRTPATREEAAVLTYNILRGTGILPA